MPYEAAKAVAATFCWTIRYALTPVFGIDFPDICIPPDSDKYMDMTIDPAITQRCTKEARMYRELEFESSSRPSSATTTTPLTPDTPTFPRRLKQFRPKPLKKITSNYTSDTGSDDSYTLSSMTPDHTYHGLWTPANTPRSMPRLPSPSYRPSRKRPAQTCSNNDLSSPELSPKSRRVMDMDEAYDGDSSDDSEVEGMAEATRKVSIGLPSDEKAAYLLMSLKLQTVNQQEFRGKKRRAST